MSCNEERTIGINNKFETTYIVFYSGNHTQKYTIYTDNEVCTCSFQGTNFLIEKDNPEELVSTTAPICIIEQYKYDKDGNKSEYKKPY